MKLIGSGQSNKFEIGICMATCMLLLLSLIPFVYPYFLYIKCFVFTASIFFAYILWHGRNRNLFTLFAFAAVLFNPFFPVFGMRETWILVNAVFGIQYATFALYISRSSRFAQNQ